MQMLPAILPNAPSSAAHLSKASEPTTEGVFQSVLNQESGKTDKPEPKPLTKQSKEKTAKHSDTDILPWAEQHPGTTPEEILNQEAQTILAGAQSLMPKPSTQEVLQEELEDSEQPVATAMEIVGAQSALPMLKGPSQTDNPLEKSIANHAGQLLAGENQPVPEILQTGAGVNDGTETAIPQVAVNSQSTQVLNAIAQQTNPEVDLPLPSAQKIASSGTSFAATEPTAVVANSIGNQREQTAIIVPETAATVAEQTNQSAQQIVPAQSVMAPLVFNGQPAAMNIPRKTKAEPLGDNRFTQLLGRQHTVVSGTVSVESAATMAATGLDNPGLGLNNFTGINPAVSATAQTDSQPTAKNMTNPTFAMGATPTKGDAIQTEMVTSPSPGIEGFNGEGASVTQPVSPEIDNLISGNNQTATGLPDGQVQPTLAAAIDAPVFSPAQATASPTATLQQNSGFPIPEQEVMEQVIQRSSLRELEGKRELTVELHPADLGQVKLKLVQDNDKLQLNLQAQSSEVRDILEKHLPRLHEALQQQGLRLETIQVSVDPQRNNSQGFFERQQQQQAQRNPWQQANRSSLRSEEQHLAVQTNKTSSTKGLSLRI